jgi:hypothetical protein
MTRSTKNAHKIRQKHTKKRILAIYDQVLPRTGVQGTGYKGDIKASTKGMYYMNCYLNFFELSSYWVQTTVLCKGVLLSFRARGREKALS